MFVEIWQNLISYIPCQIYQTKTLETQIWLFSSRVRDTCTSIQRWFWQHETLKYLVCPIHKFCIYEIQPFLAFIDNIYSQIWQLCVTWLVSNYFAWIVTSVTCGGGCSLVPEHLINMMLPVRYIHYIICQFKDYIYGLMTGVFTWINLTALSWTYLIIIEEQ